MVSTEVTVLFEFLETFLIRSIGYFGQSCFTVFKNYAKWCCTPLKSSKYWAQKYCSTHLYKMYPTVFFCHLLHHAYSKQQIRNSAALDKNRTQPIFCFIHCMQGLWLCIFTKGLFSPSLMWKMNLSIHVYLTFILFCVGSNSSGAIWQCTGNFSRELQLSIFISIFLSNCMYSCVEFKLQKICSYTLQKNVKCFWLWFWTPHPR